MSSLGYAQAYGVVVGLKQVSDVNPRREIDDLVVNEPDMFNLFLLALEALQRDYGGWQDKMSYFQVAGIHGLPNRDWDNVRGDGKQAGGYCTHNSILFPTWHRPYLAMMEQTIYNTMEQLAAQFDDPKYRLAAQKFRLPYWDYFHPREQKTTVFPGIGPGGKTSFPYDFRLPSVLKEPQLMVYRPETQEPNDETCPVLMDNPLKTFVFPTTNSIPPAEWAAMEAAEAKGKPAGASFTVAQTHTVRHGRPSNNAVDDYAALDLVLNRDREAELRILLDLIEAAPYASYGNFATSALSDAPGATSGSLEDLHGSYHVNVGGAGHMARVPVAAFDPVFWLHHCNIDRIFAVWQALHDDFIGGDRGGVARNGGPLPTAGTNLYPFRRAIVNGQERFWTSADARDVRSFGYTYPDLDAGGDRGGVLANFDAKYRWSLQRQPRRRQAGCGGGQGGQGGGLSNIPKAMQPRDVRGAQVFNYRASTLAVRLVGERKVEEMQIAGYGGNTPKPDYTGAGYGGDTQKPDYTGAGYGGEGAKKRDSAYGGSTSSWGGGSSTHRSEYSESTASAYGGSSSSAWGSSSWGGGNTPSTDWTGGGGAAAANKPGSYNEPQNKGLDGGAPRTGGYTPNQPGGSYRPAQPGSNYGPTQPSGNYGPTQPGSSYGGNTSHAQQQQQQSGSSWGSSSEHQRQQISGYSGSSSEYQHQQTGNWDKNNSATAHLTISSPASAVHCTDCGNKNIHCANCGSTKVHCTTCAGSKAPQNTGFKGSAARGYVGEGGGKAGGEPQNKGFDPGARPIGGYDGGSGGGGGGVRKIGDYGSGSYGTRTSAYQQATSYGGAAQHQRSGSWGSSEYKAGSSWDSPLQKVGGYTGYGGGGAAAEPQNKGFFGGGGGAGYVQTGAGYGSGEFQNKGFEGASNEPQDKGFDPGAHDQAGGYGSGEPQDRGFDPGEMETPVFYSRAPQSGRDCGQNRGGGGRGQHERRDCGGRPHENKSCNKCGSKEHGTERCHKPAHEHKSCNKCGSRDHHTEGCNRPAHEHKSCHKCGGKDHPAESCNNPSHEHKSCNKCGSKDHNTEGCRSNVPQPGPSGPGNTPHCGKCGSNTHGVETCGVNVPPGSTTNCTRCGSTTRGTDTCGTNAPQPGPCPPGTTATTTTHCTKCGSNAHGTETCGGTAAPSQPCGWGGTGGNTTTANCTHCGSNAHPTGTCNSSGAHHYGGQTSGGGGGGGGGQTWGGGGSTHCTSCGAQQNPEFDDGTRCTSCGCIKLQAGRGAGGAYQPGGGGGGGYQPGGGRAYHTDSGGGGQQHGWAGGFENAGHQVDSFNSGGVGRGNNNRGWTPGFENAGHQISGFDTGYEGQNTGFDGGQQQHGPEHVPSFRKGDEILSREPPGCRLVLNWYIDTEVNKDALNGAFTIYFFVGAPTAIPASPAQWQSSPIFAGLTHIFAAPREACDNCALQSAEVLKVTGTSVLTPILLDYVEAGAQGEGAVGGQMLGSLSPNDVVPFLQRGLGWRVKDTNQQQADPARVAGLKISVSATISVVRPDSPIPDFKEAMFFPEVTDGRRSGDPQAAW